MLTDLFKESNQISNGGCAVLLTAHIALGQLVFCFCFYIGSYTNVVQRIGKATSDERLLCLAKRAVLRSGHLIMESLISDVKDDMTMEDFDRFASIIRRVESLHKLDSVSLLKREATRACFLSKQQMSNICYQGTYKYDGKLQNFQKQS